MDLDAAPGAGGLVRHGLRVRADADLLAAAVEHGPLDAPVAACPGWDLRQLAVHTGTVHRWATDAIINARRPDLTTEPPDDADLAMWLRAGAGALADTLDNTDPGAATWHPFPVERQVWVWARRQAQETAIHRWDAERAVLGASSLDPLVAAEGLEEFFELALPRVLIRERVAAPPSSLHVHCTDVAGEWLVWGEDGEYRMVAEHRRGDAAIRGPAEVLLLVLMGRADRDELDVVGERGAVDAWLDLPGF